MTDESEAERLVREATYRLMNEAGKADDARIAFGMHSKEHLAARGRADEAREDLRAKLELLPKDPGSQLAADDSGYGG